MKQKKNKRIDIYSKFSFNKKYYQELVNFFRSQTTIETGGKKIFDGTYRDLLHIPEELAQLIIFLKKHEILKKNKIKKYLEIGFSHGFSNTILNKFFNFETIVAVDKFGSHINGVSLAPNLRFKNLILICNDSKSEFVVKNLKKFEKFDLIFIDGNHDYKSVKSDFNNYINLLNKDGIMIMHDIKLENSGSKNFWNEIKLKKKFTFKEIVCSKYFFKYGVGILKFK